MILPNKYVTISESYIGISAIILEIMGTSEFVLEDIWTSFENKYKKSLKNEVPYQKFIYVIEFMYICGMISYNHDGVIRNENFKN